MPKKVIIIGAGPSGVLLAHYLLRRKDNYQVDIYERRSDPRIVPFSKSRTYPITLSQRGMKALRNIEGLEEAVKAISLEVTGTIIHQKNGKTSFITRQKPLISLDRTRLAIALLEKLTQKYDDSRLKVHFDCECTQVDFAKKQAKLQNPETKVDFTVDYNLLVGADGARSVVRESFLSTENFECQQKYVPSAYKSIFLPSDNNLERNLQPGKIHSWRLDDTTSVLLLYQLDGTMSGVVTFPYKQNQVASLSHAQEVLKFFNENFPEVGYLMPTSEAEAFVARTVSRVSTIRCNRFHQGASALLIGDAAHAVSPALGQGCNAALEDVVIFDKILDENSDNLAQAVEQFSVRRLPDAHALVEMSDYAFPLSKRLFIEFILRQRIAKILHRLFPQKFLPSLFEVISEDTNSYSQVLDYYKDWIAKVKKSNEKLTVRA
ncbi:MAG: FAD-dependent monooxygenase [Chlorogloeopsis fritschii C42_A2020_084]|uniref:FAD-dependent oxidoreductase n=1 Tax=Chlorogloeopsis fritschii TaxID=1124 RepID=UPI0019EA62D8|nr:NAD(P)/FAD-dependent oxidoreductase [Chlorogloeopsis fritschii]MBF2007290.1 FAD-dependent monooxygenase [Chlorogloeopsis fritschii C42_A2020_084]